MATIGIGGVGTPLPGKKVKEPNLQDQIKKSNLNIKQQGQNIEAPVVKDVEPVISTSDLGKAQDVTTPTFNKTELQTRVTDTLTKFGNNAVANEAFIRGSLKLAGQEENEANIARLTGKTLGQVQQELKIDQSDFGVEPVEEKTVIPGVQPFSKTNETTTEAPKSTTEQLKELYGDIATVREDARGEAVEDVDLIGKSEAVTVAETKLNEALAKVQAFGRESDVADLQELKDIKDLSGKGLLKSDVAKQANTLIKERNFQDAFLAIDEGIAIDAANLALAQFQAAEGNFTRAETIVKDSADAAFETASTQIDALAALNKIETDEADAFKLDLEKDRDLQIEGYVPLEMTLDEAQKEFSRDGVFQDPISGKIYKRPEEAVDVDTQIVEIKNADGSTTKTLINSVTGETIKVVGKSSAEGKDIDFSAAELDAAGFATRVQESIRIFDEIEADVSPLLTGKASLQRTLPARFKNKDVLRQEQAERNFVTAVLRRESGAAISPEEFDTARELYFPQAGDTKEVLNQKRVSRQTALDNLERSSAGSFESGEDYFTFYSSLPQQQRNDNDDLQEELELGDSEFFEFIQEQRGANQSFSTASSDINANIKLGSRLARVNNNPGNLRFAGQRQGSQGEGGFARFPTPQAGYNALKDQIKLDAGRGLTLAKFISKFAPPNENDTNLYINQMIKATGASRNTPVKNINLDTLAKAMAKKESSTIIA